MVRNLRIAGAVILVMFMGGISIYLYGITIVNWWIPVGIALFLAIGFWLLFYPVWQRLAPEIPAAARCILHLITATIVLSAFILGLNRYGAPSDASHEVKATVSKKYQEKRNRSRRVGRGRYVKGEEYYVYCIVYTLPDGRDKTMEVSVDRYLRIPLNSTVPLHLSPGLFGWPVIDTTK